MFIKQIAKIKEIFSQGLSKKEVILAGLLGAFIGIMPVFGLSTIVAGFLALKLRLNIGVTLLFTYAVSPIHPLLFIPFIHLGENIFGIKHTLLSFLAIKEAFYLDYLDALRKLWLEFVCGMSGWSLVSIPVLLIVFYVSKRMNENAK